MTDSSKTIEKMLLILRTLSDGRVLSAKEIGEELKLNRTVVQRLLATLNQRDFVARLGGDGYALSFHLRMLADRVLPELQSAASSRARELSRSTGETVTVQVVDGLDAVVLIEQHVQDGAFHVRHAIGARGPLERGAGGKILLAFGDQRTRAKVAAADRLSDTREKELESIVRAGFAQSRDELQQGVNAAAAPIFDNTGGVVASLAILVPSFRGNDALAHREPLLATASAITSALAER